MIAELQLVRLMGFRIKALTLSIGSPGEVPMQVKAGLKYEAKTGGAGPATGGVEPM